MLPSIPSTYAEYIKETGGFECMTIDDADPGYVVLWPFEEIAQSNVDLDVASYAPGFIAFGGNGGGELLVFDETGAVFMLPTIGMTSATAIPIADNFQDLTHLLDI